MRVPSLENVWDGRAKSTVVRLRVRSIRGAGLVVSAIAFMAARRRPSAALSIDRNLRRFLLQGRPTGRVLGTGSYGTVQEVGL